MTSYEETAMEMMKALERWCKMCYKLVENSELKDFIILARDVLNVINSGHTNMGNATGFQMKLLGDLKNKKSGEESLLSALVEIYKQQCQTPIFTQQEVKLLQDLEGDSFTYISNTMNQFGSDYTSVKQSQNLYSEEFEHTVKLFIQENDTAMTEIVSLFKI